MQNQKEMDMSAMLRASSFLKKDKDKMLLLMSRDLYELKSEVREIREEVDARFREFEAGKTVGAADGNARPVAESTVVEWKHDPRAVNSFLKKFSDPTSPLRYCAHSWDSGEFDGFDYNTFVMGIEDALNADDTFRDMFLYNAGLNYALRDYLVEKNKDPRSFQWCGPVPIRIGLQYPKGCAASWMAKNTGAQLWKMPLDAFPEDYRPSGRYNGKELTNMEEVAEVFKHVIEFRDNDFVKLVKKHFDTSDIKAEFDVMALKGCRFYAYTTAVDNAFGKVEQNIRERLSSSAGVSVKVENVEKDSFELHILQEGSFADYLITGEKLKTGSIAGLRLAGKRASLMSVCDFSVKSRFLKWDGGEVLELKPYRIDYLYPGARRSADGQPEVRFTELDEDVPGFEYIFKFYK